MQRAHQRASARARSLAYGRRRAARRVEAGRFAPHPGWRHRVPDGSVVLRDQAVALARLEELVDDQQLWRADRRTVALAVLRGLVCGMSWETGLVAGITRAHLAATAGCSTRTVSRVLAWALEASLVVCVETGATAEFLGTDTNRAPSYVLTAPHGWGAVDKPGNPPAYGGWEESPWRDRGLQDRRDDGRNQPGSGSWPVYDRATTPAERARAVTTLLERAGLSGRVVSWRAVAMLAPWFEAGWSVVGLLHALDHHPGTPETSRGDAARAARDPLRVLGHRLAPWREHLDALPQGLRAVDGNRRRRTHATRLAQHDRAASWATSVGGAGHVPTATSATRAAARAELAGTLAARRTRPATSSTPSLRWAPRRAGGRG